MHGEAWRWQFSRYLVIGGAAFVIDVGSFKMLLSLQRFVGVAATLSYLLAISLHFTLNKYVNFKAYDRRTTEQASTYLVVAFVCWCTTIAIVEGGVALGLSPMLAKLFAVAINFPIGFAGHRLLTFGPGIVKVAHRLLRRGV